MDNSASYVGIIGSTSSDAPFVSPSEESECLSWHAVVDSARFGKLGFADACVHEAYPIEASSEGIDVDWMYAGSDAWLSIDTVPRNSHEARRTPAQTGIRIYPARAAAKLGHRDTNRFLDKVEQVFYTFTGAASRVAVVVVQTTLSLTEPMAGPAPRHRASKQVNEFDFVVIVVPVLPGSAMIDQERLHATIQKVIHERNSSAVANLKRSESAALPAHAPAKATAVCESYEVCGSAASSAAHRDHKVGAADAATTGGAAADLTKRLGEGGKEMTKKGGATGGSTGPFIVIAGSDASSTAYSSSKAIGGSDAKPAARWKARTPWARSRLFVATVDRSEAAIRDSILEDNPHKAAAGGRGIASPIALQTEVCVAWKDSPCTVDLSPPECALLALGLVPGYPALKVQAMSAGTPGAGAEGGVAQHAGAASTGAGRDVYVDFGETATGVACDDDRASDTQSKGMSRPTASLILLLSRLHASDSLVWHRACGALALMRKGWTLQDGAVFGADFMAYDGMPGEVHSTWSVLVVPVGSLMAPGGDAEVALHLPDGYSGADVGMLVSKSLHAAAALRGARQAGKRLLLCAVGLRCDKVGDSKAERQEPHAVREAILAGDTDFHAVDPA